MFTRKAQSAYDALIERLKQRGAGRNEADEIEAILEDIERLGRGEEIECFVTHGLSTIVTIEPGGRHWAILRYRQDEAGRRLDILEFH
jgi:hypothetical protein